MYKFFRPLFFIFPPESIHHFVMCFIKFTKYIPGFSKLFTVKNEKLKRQIFGLNFKNPLGFAAGFDKNAEVYNELSNFGFGFIEIGTVTPFPQSGNPKPRSFRLQKDQALINRMGFNNLGLDSAIAMLKKERKKNLIVGGNIGKNTVTPNEKAAADYLKCFKGLYSYVDYFVVNVSCPNIGNLHKLQNRNELEEILKGLIEYRRDQDTYRPVLLKISPDLSFEQIEDTVILIRELGVDGIVAVNTTTSRDGLTTDEADLKDIGNGGLSGAPLTARALEVVRFVSNMTSGELPIIGVGGIMTEEDAVNMLNAGASLIQVYTGFIYQGPSFAKRILKSIH